MDTTLDIVKKVKQYITDEPLRIEVRKAPSRATGKAYISLSQIGVKPGDPILVVVFKDTLVVSKIHKKRGENK